MRVKSAIGTTDIVARGFIPWAGIKNAIDTDDIVAKGFIPWIRGKTTEKQCQNLNNYHSKTEQNCS